MTAELKRTAFFLAHHRGVSEEDVFNELVSRFTSPDRKTSCPQCGVELKWKNLLAHVVKKHPIKIRWKNIPIIRAQKQEREKLKKALGSMPTAHFVQGGAPGLKK